MEGVRIGVVTPAANMDELRVGIKTLASAHLWYGPEQARGLVFVPQHPLLGIETGEAIVCVAIKDEAVIGYVLLRRGNRIRDPEHPKRYLPYIQGVADRFGDMAEGNFAFLRSWAVNPEFCKRGLAQDMLRRAMDHAADTGTRLILGHRRTDPTNVPYGMRALMRVGFLETDYSFTTQVDFGSHIPEGYQSNTLAVTYQGFAAATKNWQLVPLADCDESLPFERRYQLVAAAPHTV